MYETVLERFPGWVLENFTEVHSRPQSPSFLSHVVGKRGALDVGRSRYRMSEKWTLITQLSTL